MFSINNHAMKPKFLPFCILLFSAFIIPTLAYADPADDSPFPPPRATCTAPPAGYSNLGVTFWDTVRYQDQERLKSYSRSRRYFAKEEHGDVAVDLYNPSLCNGLDCHERHEISLKLKEAFLDHNEVHGIRSMFFLYSPEALAEYIASSSSEHRFNWTLTPDTAGRYVDVSDPQSICKNFLPYMEQAYLRIPYEGNIERTFFTALTKGDEMLRCDYYCSNCTMAGNDAVSLGLNDYLGYQQESNSYCMDISNGANGVCRGLAKFYKPFKNPKLKITISGLPERFEDKDITHSHFSNRYILSHRKSERRGYDQLNGVYYIDGLYQYSNGCITSIKPEIILNMPRMVMHNSSITEYRVWHWLTRECTFDRVRNPDVQSNEDIRISRSTAGLQGHHSFNFINSDLMGLHNLNHDGISCTNGIGGDLPDEAFLAESPIQIFSHIDGDFPDDTALQARPCENYIVQRQMQTIGHIKVELIDK